MNTPRRTINAITWNFDEILFVATAAATTTAKVIDAGTAGDATAATATAATATFVVVVVFMMHFDPIFVQ
jgi:hypothetical protein